MDSRLTIEGVYDLSEASLRPRTQRTDGRAKPIEIQYLFQAIVEVDADQWADFDKQHMGKAGDLLVDLHRRAGLELKHASILREGESAKTFTFFNFWKIGSDVNALAQAELTLADNVTWSTFDKVVQLDEDKDIVFPLADVRQASRPARLTRGQYLRIEYDVHLAELAEFQAQLEARLETFGLEHGWMGGDTYLHLTGREGRAVQMWIVPVDLDESEGRAVMATMPWLKDSRGKRRLLRPDSDARPLFLAIAPFDPFNL